MYIVGSEYGLSDWEWNPTPMIKIRVRFLGSSLFFSFSSLCFFRMNYVSCPSSLSPSPFYTCNVFIPKGPFCPCFLFLFSILFEGLFRHFPNDGPRVRKIKGKRVCVSENLGPHSWFTLSSPITGLPFLGPSYSSQGKTIFPIAGLFCRDRASFFRTELSS